MKSKPGLLVRAMRPYLQGERVRLRPLESEADLRSLYEMWNDPESAGEHLTYEAWSWDGFCKYVHGLDKSPDQQTFLLVVTCEGGAVVGFVNHRYPYPWRSTIEIGYLLRPAGRGKGYAAEATGLLVDYLFSNRPVERVEALTGSENLPSRRLLEGLGFKEEGRTRRSFFAHGEYTDTAIYGLLRQEWKAHDPPPRPSPGG